MVTVETSDFANRDDVKDDIERLQTLITPAMTVILGIIVGWIIFSVLGPIYDAITELDI